MGFKVVTIKMGAEDVIVGWVPEEAYSVKGADLHDKIFETQACPEPGSDIRRFIDSNPQRSFDLHKLVDGEPQLRTIYDLKDSMWIDWEYNWEPEPAPEPSIEPQIIEEEGE